MTKTKYTHFLILHPAVSLGASMRKAGEVVEIDSAGLAPGHLKVIHRKIIEMGNTFHVLQAGRMVRGKFVPWKPPAQAPHTTAGQTKE